MLLFTKNMISPFGGGGRGRAFFTFFWLKKNTEASVTIKGAD